MAYNRGSINKVMLVGRCGADPEVRSLPSGDSVANVSLATTSGWRDRQSNENKERTEWHRLVFFGRVADTVSQYVRKGSLIYVEGSLRTREWEKDGVKRYSTEVVADQMTMLGGRDNNRPEAPNAPDTGRPATPSTNTSTPSGPPNTPDGSATDDIEDDIPF